MNPAIKGWKNGWRSFGKALLPLQDDFPEVIALMRYLVGMVSTNHRTSASSSPSSSQARVEPLDWASTTTASAEGTSRQAILFIPILSESYCFGSCLRVAREVHRSDPKIPIYITKPSGPPVDFPDYVHLLDFSSLRKKGWKELLGSLATATSCWRAICRALQKEDVLCEEMTRVYGNWKVHLLRWACLYHYDERLAASFLKRNRIGSVVTINDTVKPGSPLITASRKLKIRSVVLQHGTPGPHSAPFIADEAWLWGETSREALLTFGADSSRLRVMGALESESVELSKASPRNGPRVLVFLAQWRAAKGWSEPFFQEVFNLLREVLAKRPEKWELRLRLHPTDPVEAKSDIASRLHHSNFKVVFGQKGKSMSDEIASADALLSVNSSGLMNGVSANLPTAQILPRELEAVVGPALLNSENLLRDGVDLDRWLSRVEKNDLSILNSTSQVLANRGKVAPLMADDLISSL